jgi:hypothetical protein
VSPASCFGSDVIGAKDQAQMCFRHINPQICVRRAPGYGFDNCDEMLAFGGTSGWRSRVTAFPRAIPENSGATGLQSFIIETKRTIKRRLIHTLHSVGSIIPRFGIFSRGE